jgi:hypothetical protein
VADALSHAWPCQCPQHLAAYAAINCVANAHRVNISNHIKAFDNQSYLNSTIATPDGS